MADLDPKIVKAFQELSRLMGINTSSGGRFNSSLGDSSGYGSSKKSSGSIKSLEESMGAFNKMVKDVKGKLQNAGNTVDEYDEALSDFNKALRKNATLASAMLNEVREFNGEIHQLTDFIGKQSKIAKMFTSTMGQANARAAMMSSALLASHEYVKSGSTRYKNMMENLEEAVTPLNKSLLEAAGVLDTTTGSLKSNLQPRHFSAVRASLGSLVSSINESVSAFGVNSLREMMEGAGGWAGLHKQIGNDKELKNALLKAVTDAAAKGVNVEVNTKSGTQSLFKDGKLNEEAYNQLRDQNASLVRAISVVSDAAEGASASIKKLDIEARNASSAFYSFNKSNILADLKDKFSELGEASTIAANIGKAKAAFGDLYREIVAFNAAMVPETYLGTQLAAIKLGMSFEDTVKFMQENKRMMAIYGADGFEEVTGNMKATFQKFGLNMAQAADAIAPMTDAAISAGVNIRDAEAMDRFANQTMESYRRMASIVDMTAAQFAQMNAQLLSNEDIQSTLIGMDAERSQAYAQDTLAVRDHYIQMGLSAESANELLLAQRRQAREGVIQRVGGAARAMLLAQQTGMSQAESQELFNLSKKGIRTAEEDARLAELQGRVGRGIEQGRVAAYDRGEGAGFAYDAMTESLTSQLGAGGDAIRAARELEQKKRAGVPLTDEELARTQAVAQGSEALAGFSNVINSISSLINSSMVGAATASTLALTGLAMQAYRAAMALRTVGGGGGLMDMLPGRRRGGRRVNARGVPRRPGAAARLDRMNAARAARGAPPMPGRAPAGGAPRGFRPRVRAGSPASIAASLAGGYLLNEAINSGAVSEETGNTLNAGLDVAAMAATGATIGSFIPVIGTAAGGLIGGAYGLYRNWDTLGGGITDLGKKALEYSPMGLAYSAGKSLIGSMTPEGGTAIDGLKAIGQTAFNASPLGLGMSAGRSVLGMLGVGGAGSTISAFAGSGDQPVTGTSTAKVNSIARQAGITEISNVQDLATHHHLSTVVAKLDEAITLLKVLSNDGTVGIEDAGKAGIRTPAVPSATTAIYGA